MLPAFTEPEITLPCSEERSIEPCPEPVEFTPHHHILFLLGLFLMSSHRALVFQAVFHAFLIIIDIYRTIIS